MRIRLSQNPEFEPYTAFKQLDRFSLSTLNSSDIRDFVLRNRIYAGEADI